MQYPDVLLHTHLEGSIPYDVLRSICYRNLLHCHPREYYIYTNYGKVLRWEEFRQIFSSICSSLINYEDFYDLIVGYGKKLKKENINLAEFHFSPWKHLSRGIKIDVIEKGLFDGIEYLKSVFGFDAGLIIDFVRKTEEEVDFIADWVRLCGDRYIKAIGISGGLPSIPRNEYYSVVEKIKKDGFKVVAHAGEIEGVDSIVEVINCFDPDRICHGIKCVHDEKLMALIKQKNIHLEICPSANQRLGVISDSLWEIAVLIKNGISFSINTDDELIFNTNLYNEFNLLYNYGVLSEDDVEVIIKNTNNNAFIKRELLCVEKN